ncbi:MAG: hypothetical protein KJO28_05150 [Desulfofustis sp.]|nr:hypothetical protein [Desulfofustis sp.]NNF46276.1 hypothetical protein [Desulfofustis sp.]NNK56492.1 hypothetical protein [Desulfofustis sp.]
MTQYHYRPPIAGDADFTPIPRWARTERQSIALAALLRAINYCLDDPGDPIILPRQPSMAGSCTVFGNTWHAITRSRERKS